MPGQSHVRRTMLCFVKLLGHLYGQFVKSVVIPSALRQDPSLQHARETLARSRLVFNVGSNFKCAVARRPTEAQSHQQTQTRRLVRPFTSTFRARIILRLQGYPSIFTHQITSTKFTSSHIQDGRVKVRGPRLRRQISRRSPPPHHRHLLTIVQHRQELVAWLNNLLQLNITKVEQCGTGYVTLAPKHSGALQNCHEARKCTMG